jgi:hypothetical protein
MSTLDEITKEKQRVSETLVRVDAQREKLVSQLGELEATERVLARYSKGVAARRTASTKAPTTAKTTTPAQSRRQPRRTAAKPAAAGTTSPSLAIRSLFGKRQDAAGNRRCARGSRQPCRHRPAQAGPAASKSDGKLYAIQSTRTGNRPRLIPA